MSDPRASLSFLHPLTPPLISSLCTAPLACDWLLDQSELMIRHHTQHLTYWTQLKKDLTKGAALAAATVGNHTPLSPTSQPPHPDKKALFMDALATKLNTGPPAARSRATSLNDDGGGGGGGGESPPPDVDRSPSLSHAQKPKMVKGVKGGGKGGLSFRGGGAGGGGVGGDGSGEEAEQSPVGEGPVGGGKGEELKEAEGGGYVQLPVAHPVNPLLEGAGGVEGKEVERPSPFPPPSKFAPSTISYVPPPTTTTKPTFPPSSTSRSGASSTTSSPSTSTPPSPSAVAMAAAARRPPPVPPTRGGASRPPSQPVSPKRVDEGGPTGGLPPVPTLSASPTPPFSFQPRSLPTPPTKAKLPPTTPPIISTPVPASAAPPAFPPPGPDTSLPNPTSPPTTLPPLTASTSAVSSDEDYLARRPSADPPADTSAPSTPPSSAPPPSSEARMGALGGFKLPATAGGGDLFTKLKKREPTEAAASAASASGGSVGVGGGGFGGVTVATVAPAAGVGPTSPRLRMVQAPAPVPVVATVAPCTTPNCKCDDFKQDKFKPNKCSNCFHQH